MGEIETVKNFILSLNKLEEISFLMCRIPFRYILTFLPLREKNKGIQKFSFISCPLDSIIDFRILRNYFEKTLFQFETLEIVNTDWSTLSENFQNFFYSFPLHGFHHLKTLNLVGNPVKINCQF